MARDEAYQKAEETIEEARRSGAKRLDLNAKYDATDSKKLTEVPESLGQLTQLQSLNLSDNRLTALPEWLSQLTELQSLNLSGNRLTALPEWLSRLPELKVSCEHLTSVPSFLRERLQELDLSRKRLKVLPDSISQLTQLHSLNLSDNQLTALPESLGQLTQLRSLDLSGNQLTALPESFCRLTCLERLDARHNRLVTMPMSIGKLPRLKEVFFGGNAIASFSEAKCQLTAIPLQELNLANNGLTAVPQWLGDLTDLRILNLYNNRLKRVPDSLGRLTHLVELELGSNPLDLELGAAYREGLAAVKRYLRAKAEAQVVLNEAKLILIGEGEVGKSCLLGTMRGDNWIEKRDTTHGIEIKPVKMTDSATGTEITLNGWDFGGQRVYRPTHQLFFSAPAVYLVVWKPREGPQQGFVKEWIKLVKHREPDAKILVVATHGGPKERQPDIDRQEIWDLFGKETVVDFFHVDSKSGDCIPELKKTIAQIAASLPEVGRQVAKSWQDARVALKDLGCAYVPIRRAIEVCGQHQMKEDDARLFLALEHRLGHLIHYTHDPLLRDIVVLKPDWLATAISYVLDDKETREVQHGLVSFERLGQLWNDPARPEDSRYEPELHPLFVRLMERFDLSYKVAIPSEANDAVGFLQRMRSRLTGQAKTAKVENYTSLVAQLVPDVRPTEGELAAAWPMVAAAGEEEQVQICRIVEAANNQSAHAEGLFYQLIVRLHRYSLGRANFKDSLHWQRGLLLADDTGARALLEHTANDVRITVRSPYPARFLGALTLEVQYLVQSFWTGLRCDVTVPCLISLPSGELCKGLFEVGKLLENKKRRRAEVPCPLCNEWQSVEQLLGNAPAARPSPMEELLANQAVILRTLGGIRTQLSTQQVQILGRFDQLDAASKELVAKVEAAYSGLIRTLLDEAKEGPRLFSLQPVDSDFFDRPNWIAQKFRLTFWCEHSRQPLPFLNSAIKGDTTLGVYEFEIPKEWFVKAAPVLKTFASVASLVLPVASAQLKLGMDESAYKAMEKQLDFGQRCVESVLKGGDAALKDLEGLDNPELPELKGMTARGTVLRQLHAWLKEKDQSYAKLGLVRVINRRQEFLWVHPQFEKEY